MAGSSFGDIIVGLGAGVAGVLLLVIGVPLCVVFFWNSFARALRRRRFNGAAVGAVVIAAVALAGLALWNLAQASAPGVYDGPLVMLAMTFLPFTASFAAIALIVRHHAAGLRSPLAATSRRPTYH